MKYVVSDEFGGGAGWTADTFALALKEPMAKIGIVVERTSGFFSEAGFQPGTGSSPEQYKRKSDEVRRVVDRVLSSIPPPPSR